jgi:hypothetical protein
MAYNNPDDQQGFYTGANYDYDSQQGYDMNAEQFPQDTQFGQFDYNPSANPPAYSESPYAQTPYVGSIMTPDPVASFAPASTEEDYENEPPLMEELGINFDHIRQKSWG